MTAIHGLTTFQKKLQDDIGRSVARLLGRRRVTGFDGARVRTVGFDPGETADRPLRWLRPEVGIGDDVLTVRQGDEEIVLGAFRRATDGAPDTELRSRLTAVEGAIDALQESLAEGTVYKNNGSASTTGTAGVDVSVLSLEVGAWEIWEVTWYLPGGSTGAGGQTLSFTGPSGAVLRGTVEASSGTAGVDLTRPIPALGTTVSGGFLPSTLTGVMVVRGVYVGVGNAGTLRTRLHAVTSGESANVSTQSHMLARRVS
jgi:hypothetical protein